MGGVWCVFGVQQVWYWSPALLLTSCVTVDRSPDSSEPQFPHQGQSTCQLHHHEVTWGMFEPSASVSLFFTNLVLIQPCVSSLSDICKFCLFFPPVRIRRSFCELSKVPDIVTSMVTSLSPCSAWSKSWTGIRSSVSFRVCY